MGPWWQASTIGAVTRLLLATCVGAVGLVTGCSSASTAAREPATSADAGPTAAGCPVVTTARFDWPADYPKDLPQPPAATPGRVSRTPDGLTLTRFTTATSLAQGVSFVRTQLERTGFHPGPGDAEDDEADVPFAKGGVRGVMKMISTGTCSTSWLVAITRQGQPGSHGGGLLPTPYRSTGPSPYAHG